MAKQQKKTEERGPTVTIGGTDDGRVALVFDRPVTTFIATAADMTQLGVNLIRGSYAALLTQQPTAVPPVTVHSQAANVQAISAVPKRKM